MPKKISTVYTYACEHCGERFSGEDESIVVRETQVCEVKGQPEFKYEIGDGVYLCSARSWRFSHKGWTVTGRFVERGTHAALYDVNAFVLGVYRITTVKEKDIQRGDVGKMVTGGLRFSSISRSTQ